MTIRELRSVLEKLDNPYIHVLDGSAKYPRLLIESMDPDNPVGCVVTVDEFYIGSKTVEYEDNPELVNVHQIEFEKQPYGGYKVFVHSYYATEVDSPEVTVSKHEDAL